MRTTALILISSMLFSATLAHATGSPYCDTTCGYLVNASTQQVLGLSGTAEWNSNDTAACANIPPPTGTGTVTLSQFQCTNHTGILMQQCMAYVATQGPSKTEKILADLDLAAGAVCMVACAAPTALPISWDLAAACNYTAMGVGAVELVDVFTQKSTPVGKTVDSILGAAGVAGGALAQFGPAAFGAATTTLGHTIIPMACVTSALMILESVLRNKDFGSAQETQQQACNQITALNSTAPSIGGTTPTANTAQAAPQAIAGTPTSLGGAVTTLSGSGATGFSNLACAKNGIGTQSGGCGVSGQLTSSADTAMLSGPLAASAANFAAQNPGLMNALSSGGDPSSSMSGASGPQLAAMQALGDLAKVGAENAAQLGGLDGKTFAVPANTAGAGAAAAKGKATSTFEFGSSVGAASAPTETAFRNVAQVQQESSDIWHEGYSGSIFDIVHHKIIAVYPRVEELPWNTALNHALSVAPASSR